VHNLRVNPERHIEPDPRRWLVLAIAASGLFLICVDLTVLYVALPALTKDLGAGNSAKLWILNAYPIVVAGLLPGLGTLGDRHGHRRLFLFGLVTFGIASLAAAYAPDATLLVVARAFLGVGAAMMMPATLAIIRANFSDTRERAFAIGLWSGMAAGGMALGPIIAGLLLEHFWWGSVFLINVPVVMVALALTLWLVPARAAPGGPPWDLVGSLQILMGLTSLVYAIKELARQGRSLPALLIAALLSVVFFIAYLKRQNRREHPLIDLSLFRLPDFGGAFAAACLGTAGGVGAELILSQYLQLVEQRSPLQAALVVLPMAIAGFISGPLAGRVMHRLRPSHFACGAFVLAAASVLCLAMIPPTSTHYPALRMALLVGVGLGIGASVTFASSTIMGAAPPERGGMAASIEEVGFELGSSLGVAVFGSVMTATYAMSLVLPDAATLPANVRDSLDEALLVADSLEAEAAGALRDAGRAAFTDALRAVLIGIGLLWLATGALIAWPGRYRLKSSQEE
jgi:DHA2 family multidrug resistance protein-like MFS transporter